MSVELRMYTYSFESNGWNAVDITDVVEEITRNSGLRKGLVHVFTPEKKCMVVFIEYEPSLLSDLEEFMEKYMGSPGVLEGLLGKSIIAPFIGGSLDIGVFKRIAFIDFSRSSGKKKVIIVIEDLHD